MYYKTIWEIIQIEGDTDKTVCIVIGIVGALVGFHHLNKDMLSKVLEFDCKNDAYIQPLLCSFKLYTIQNIHKLLNKNPKWNLNLSLINRKIYLL